MPYLGRTRRPGRSCWPIFEAAASRRCRYGLMADWVRRQRSISTVESACTPAGSTVTHAHFVMPSPDNRFALTTDLGLDQVIVYRLEPTKSSLVLNDPPFARLPPGSGPRHLAFHPRAPYVYVNGETDSTVSALSFNAQAGTLSTFQTVSTLPDGFSGTNTTAEIQVDPAGRFVYVSNRGHDSIAILKSIRRTARSRSSGMRRRMEERRVTSRSIRPARTCSSGIKARIRWSCPVIQTAATLRSSRR